MSLLDRKLPAVARRPAVLAAALIVAMLFVQPSVASAVSHQAIMLTTDPHYDRNASIFKASDGAFWLFFTRGRDVRGIRDHSGYNPDLDYYDIYYKTARNLQDLQQAQEYKIPLTPPDNAQRDVSALQTGDGRIYVFTSTGLGPGTQRSVFYYMYDGISWSGPVAIPNTDYAAHIDALENAGNIWLFYDVGYSLYALELSGSPVLITTDATIGKAIASGRRFYVVWAHVDAGANIWGDYIGLSTSNDGSTWTNSGGIASWPGLTNWDPVLFEDKGLFRLFWAPSNSEQFIATSQSAIPTDPACWSPPARVTTASYDSETWWDFWPQVIKDENCNIVLFYTSESSPDGTHRIDGNIWMMNLGGACGPVGGIVAPANTMVLLAPYLALLGLVLAGTIVVSSCVTQHRKPES